MAIMRCSLISSFVLLSLSSDSVIASIANGPNKSTSNKYRRQICSCSPQRYIFQLSLNREECGVNEIDLLPGITETSCSTFHGGFTNSEFDFEKDPADEGILAKYDAGTLLAGISWLGVADDVEWSKKEKKELAKLERENEKQNNQGLKRKEGESVRRLRDQSSLIEVVNSARFTEINSQGVVIQDLKVDFVPGMSDGDTIQFNSVSSLLTSEVPLEVQQAFIPASAVFFMEGLDEDGNLVLSRVAWRFGNHCDIDAAVMEGGEAFGFIDFGELINAPVAFCPANNDVPTLSPTIYYSPTIYPTSSPVSIEYLPTSYPNMAPYPNIPTFYPSYFPTLSTPKPTRRARKPHTEEPTPKPTKFMTARPSPEPTRQPTPSPSPKPTRKPSTQKPSAKPTREPSTPKPSPEPTTIPVTETPSYLPTTAYPSYVPTTSTDEPVRPDTDKPTSKIIDKPSHIPNMLPYIPTTHYPSHLPPIPTYKPPRPDTPSSYWGDDYNTHQESDDVSYGFSTKSDKSGKGSKKGGIINGSRPYVPTMQYPHQESYGFSSKSGKSGKGSKSGGSKCGGSAWDGVDSKGSKNGGGDCDGGLGSKSGGSKTGGSKSGHESWKGGDKGGKSSGGGGSKSGGGTLQAGGGGAWRA